MNYQTHQRLRRGRREEQHRKIVLGDFYVRTYFVAKHQSIFFGIGSEGMPEDPQLLIFGSGRSFRAKFLRASEKERLAVRQPARRSELRAVNYIAQSRASRGFKAMKHPSLRAPGQNS